MDRDAEPQENAPLLGHTRQGRCNAKFRARNLRIATTILVVLMGVIFLLVRFFTPGPTLAYPTLDNTTDSLRLLHLEPGKGWVQCKLESTTFAKGPTYSALSYAWGDERYTKPIKINGAKVKVRENLYNALYNIRDPKEVQILWVDALCIDQSNTEEKNQQVPLMSFIYSRAHEVLVWLGHHTPPDWVQESHPSWWTGSWGVRKGNATWYWGTHFWLDRLIQEEYWKRAWIVQEIGMASAIKVYFGTQWMPWTEFMKLVRLYHSRDSDSAADNILKLDRLRQSKYRDGDSYSVGSLLDTFRDAFCAVMHDKIYAFLGMANDHFHGLIPVDYSTPLTKLYLDVIGFQSSSSFEPASKRIDMVYFSGLVRRLLSREADLIPKELFWFGVCQDPESHCYSSCKDGICGIEGSGDIILGAVILDGLVMFKNWLWSFIVAPRVELSTVWPAPGPENRTTWVQGLSLNSLEHITIRGAIVGNVSYIGPSYAEILASADATRRWAATISQHFPNENDLKKARGRNERLMALLGASADFRIRNIASFRNSSDRVSATAPDGPRLFIGSDIMLGLVPPDVKEGDIICQFWNSSGSAVLRKDSNGSYVPLGRSGIIRDGQKIDWDVPINREPFGQQEEKGIDLTIDLTTLTLLSLDTVNLPGTK